MLIADLKFRLKGLPRYINRIKGADYVTEVGFFSEDSYGKGKSVAYIAYLNEYGGHNPPRPFMQRTFQLQFKAWTELFSSTLKSQGVNAHSIRYAHKTVGHQAMEDMKQTIEEWSPSDPRFNKPATIAAKARKIKAGKSVAKSPETALIDSGKMRDSIKSKTRLK